MGVLGNFGLWRHVHDEDYGILVLSSLSHPGLHEVRSFMPPQGPHHNVLFAIGSTAVEPTINEL